MSRARLFLTIAALAAGVGVRPSAAQPPMPMPAQDFVKAAAASDEYEILAGRVAATQSPDPRIRAFGLQMIQDHTQTSQVLREAAQQSGLPATPMALDDDGQKFLAELQSLRGADFDKAYVQQQVLAHQRALVVEQGYAAQGSDGNVRQAAQAAIPVIERHLAMARQMRAMSQGS